MSVSSTGKVWMNLLIKHFEACKQGDEERRSKLFDLMDGLEDEFPEAVAEEIQRSKDYAGT